MEQKIIYSLSDILALLPHREPFLFIDKVIEFELNRKIVATKYFSADTPFFKGHFPSEPILPGVLITDALAQASGLMWSLTQKERQGSSEQNKYIFFLAADHMKYLEPVRPDTNLVLQSIFLENIGVLFKYDVDASVNGVVVAKGDITLAMRVRT